MDATIILKQESLQSKVDSIEQAMNATTIRINDLENVNKIDVDDMTLNEYKDYKQDLNKQALSEFLAKSSITYNDKEYGVSEEDQNEMAMNMIIYQLYQKLGIPSILEWHAKKEQCSTFTEEEFTTLIVKMKSFVYPYIQYCQAIKAQIYACETKDGVSNISFDCIFVSKTVPLSIVLATLLFINLLINISELVRIKSIELSNVFACNSHNNRPSLSIGFIIILRLLTYAINLYHFPIFHRYIYLSPYTEL